VAYAAVALAGTAQATAAAAGVVAAGAVSVNTAQSAAIGTLQGEMNTVQANVLDLQQKTTTQSFSALSGTTFSGRVNIGSTIAGVELHQTVASVFGSGITSSGLISTTNVFTSTGGTSQMDSLLVNNNFEVAMFQFLCRQNQPIVFAFYPSLFYPLFPKTQPFHVAILQKTFQKDYAFSAVKEMLCCVYQTKLYMN
jgi:hypothetical protein